MVPKNRHWDWRSRSRDFQLLDCFEGSRKSEARISREIFSWTKIESSLKFFWAWTREGEVYYTFYFSTNFLIFNFRLRIFRKRWNYCWVFLKCWIGVSFGSSWVWKNVLQSMKIWRWEVGQVGSLWSDEVSSVGLKIEINWSEKKQDMVAPVGR